MKIVTVIQARRGSTRLPDKVMLSLAGKPLLVRMVERVLASKLAGTVVVATTTDGQDDIIEQLCAEHGLICFRGHPTDLLDRHYQAALAHQADVVIKIPSDCPLIDPAVIDLTIQYFLDNAGKYDFVSNLHPATYPDGNDVEIMTLAAIRQNWEQATRPHEREHTTPYLWDSGLFRCANVPWATGKDWSMSHRFTIDYREDYDFIKRVYEELFEQNPHFSLEDILALLEQKPEIYEINSKFAGVNWYRNHLEDLKTVDASKTRNV